MPGNSDNFMVGKIQSIFFEETQACSTYSASNVSSSYRTTDGHEDSDLSTDRVAAEVIDTMAINIPKNVFPPIFEFASLNFNHNNPKFMEASVTALGVVSEGCFELLKDKLEHVLHIVLGALKDPSTKWKSHTMHLAAFCEDMGEEILPYLDLLMGRLVLSLQNCPRNLQETCMSTIGSVASAAEQAFIP